MQDWQVNVTCAIMSCKLRPVEGTCHMTSCQHCCTGSATHNYKYSLSLTNFQLNTKKMPTSFLASVKKQAHARVLEHTPCRLVRSWLALHPAVVLQPQNWLALLLLAHHPLHSHPLRCEPAAEPLGPLHAPVQNNIMYYLGAGTGLLMKLHCMTIFCTYSALLLGRGQG